MQTILTFEQGSSFMPTTSSLGISGGVARQLCIVLAAVAMADVCATWQENIGGGGGRGGGRGG
jgi:hypothetical protein